MGGVGAGEALARSLELRAVDSGVYAAPPVELGWFYGGYLLALCLRAAALSGPDGCQVQSLHAQFIGRGDVAQPAHVVIEGLRDGTLSFRGLQVVQDDRLLVAAQAVLHVPGAGPDYQSPLPATPGPDAAAWEPSDWAGFDANLGVEVREDMTLATNPPVDGTTYGSTRRLWARLPGLPEDDPVLAQCAMAFVSDMRHGMALKPALGLPPLGRSAQAATTGHTMWFHRQPAVPGWMLLDYKPVAAASSIGLATCDIFDTSGRHLATTAQDVRYRFET
jgi:acyl-CoA thioesterase-2